jgi:HD-GYP domain-containing protein (c-di-GMP phosphodiesterase class II)
VKLIPFSGQYLRLNEPLPFGVRDDAGRLLLAAGRLIETEDMLAEFRGQSLFSDEAESAEWNRRLAGAMDQMLRQGAALKDVAGARPDAAPREVKPPKALTLTEMWQELVMHLDQALRDVRPDSDWQQRVLSVHARVRVLAQRRLDASLYLLVYAAAHSVEKYSCHHALLSMLMSEQAASMLGWEQPWIDSLGRAALTMNVAMLKLQDQLATTQHAPTADMRVEITAHSATGARMLRRAGLDDELACSVVALHHDSSQADVPLADLSPERQLARLLRRVDIFGAKISRRATRAPMSPVQAAREACLGPKGVPDEIGGALLKAVGLYPPGSFVELACGEVGIVVARGRRANLPYVASLVSAAGNVLGEPALRDTLEARFNVKSAVPPNQVKVRPPHERLLTMRTA